MSLSYIERFSKFIVTLGSKICNRVIIKDLVKNTSKTQGKNWFNKTPAFTQIRYLYLSTLKLI